MKLNLFSVTRNSKIRYPDSNTNNIRLNLISNICKKNKHALLLMHISRNGNLITPEVSCHEKNIGNWAPGNFFGIEFRIKHLYTEKTAILNVLDTEMHIAEIGALAALARSCDAYIRLRRCKASRFATNDVRDVVSLSKRYLIVGH